MDPDPAHLRIAAEGLRTTARRLELDLAPLAEEGDRRTWEGPAAAAYRRAALEAERRGRCVADGLRRIARRLDTAATEAEEAERVARARAEEAERVGRARAEAARDDRAASALVDRPMWPPQPSAPPERPPLVTGSGPLTADELFPVGGGGRG